MRKGITLAVTLALIAVIAAVVFYRPGAPDETPLDARNGGCLVGAFLGDAPRRSDIWTFQKDYGKKPYFVMIFVDWENYPDPGVINDILNESCRPIVTWEPWTAYSKRPTDIDNILEGGYDDYIRDFARKVDAFPGKILLRFAHEMNGDWYPWSGARIGAEKYKEMYRYVKDIFDDERVDTAGWVFSINWEDVPPIAANDMMNYYPGDDYVDYVGIDGYNWGTTQPWSRWMSFYEIFGGIYRRVVNEIGKPVIITEFSSASEGGDKAEWIREAMDQIKRWDMVKGFVLFNVLKETDWTFPANEKSGRQLRESISDPHFTDNPREAI